MTVVNLILQDFTINKLEPLLTICLSCGYTREGFSWLQLASSRLMLNRRSRAMGEALHTWAMGKSCTLERWHCNIWMRRGSIVTVFSRIAGTTFPLELGHCFKTNLVFWLVECPIPKGNVI